MKKILLIPAMLFSFAACNVEHSDASTGNNTETNNTITPKVTILLPTDFKQQIETNPKAQLIDVRTPGEFNAGHLQGATNVNIGDADFMDKMAKLDKTQPIFVYCAVGGRSANAADKLAAAGFTDVYDLKGGITRWTNEGLTVVK